MTNQQFHAIEATGEMPIQMLCAEPAAQAQAVEPVTQEPYTGHESDCAVHSMPAYPAGPCDCRFAKPAPATPRVVTGADVETMTEFYIEHWHKVKQKTAIRMLLEAYELNRSKPAYTPDHGAITDASGFSI